MMKSKKVLAMLMAACLMATSLAGCADSAKEKEQSTVSKEESKQSAEASGTTAAQEETKEPVTLTWWYPGTGEQKDTEKVNEYLNEQLKTYEGLEHVTIELHPIADADYGTQLTLALSADSQIDIVGSAYMYPFSNLMEDGILISMDPYMDLVPELTAALPEWLMEYGKYNGEQYMIPNYQQARNIGLFETPQEYLDKGYITQEQLERLSSDKTPIEERVQLIEDYVYAVREGEGSDTKYAPLIASKYCDDSYYSGWFDSITSQFIVRADSTEVVFRPFEENTKYVYGVAADWYENGLVPGDPTIDYHDYSYENSLNEEAMILGQDHTVEELDVLEAELAESYGFKIATAWMNDYVYSS